jgi:hypothetical protein
MHRSLQGALANLVALLQLGLTKLGGGLSDALLECSVERGIGIEADSECDIQYGAVMAIDTRQQALGMLDPKPI